jgi:hypothetical protein
VGQGAFLPPANPARDKIRSVQLTQQKLAGLPVRATPRFLRVIVTPDDKRQANRLEADHKGDLVVMKWEAFVKHVGSS